MCVRCALKRLLISLSCSIVSKWKRIISTSTQNKCKSSQFILFCGQVTSFSFSVTGLSNVLKIIAWMNDVQFLYDRLKIYKTN